MYVHEQDHIALTAIVGTLSMLAINIKHPLMFILMLESHS